MQAKLLDSDTSDSDETDEYQRENVDDEGESRQTVLIH